MGGKLIFFETLAPSKSRRCLIPKTQNKRLMPTPKPVFRMDDCDQNLSNNSMPNDNIENKILESVQNSSIRKVFRF